MKFGALIAGAALFATPAQAANDWSLNYRGLDFDNGNEADQYTLTLDSGHDWVRFGAEANSTQGDAGDLTDVAINGGVNVAIPWHITLKPRLEIGYGHVRHGDAEGAFYGASIGIERPLFGPVMGEVSYRWREAEVDAFDSERVSFGAKVLVTDRVTFSAGYVQDSAQDYDGFMLGFGARF